MLLTTELIINARCYAKGTSLAYAYSRHKRIKNMGSRSEAQMMVDHCMSDLDVKRKSEIVDDMVMMARKYHFDYEEYFYYHFMEKSLDERLSFVSDIVRCDFVRSLNKAVNQHVFDDKGNCAKQFSKYYQRDFCVYYKPLLGKMSFGRGETVQIDGFHQFTHQHNRFIVKPIASSCGKGVRICNVSDYAGSDELLIVLENDYCVGWNGGFIAEEVIDQDKQMAGLHPSSVNTCRLTTIKYDNRVEVIHPFMRIGRGGKVVDNGGAGGLLANIDPETGRIFACMDENAIIYEKHPDTGLDIIGFTIPHWNEALALAKELALVVKGNRYTGWDLALTNKGWVMVEGNPMGQFVGWQIPTQKGFKSEANTILKELNLKPLKY